jgi:N-acetyl-anhydromuramyl-L-alanine amidase AmpD
MADELHRYPYSDISRRASLSVSHIRRASPIGALIHSTDGVNSADWLVGGSAVAGKPASANYLIGRKGQRTKLCADERFPYHAGNSRWYYNGVWRADDEVSELLLGYELECSWAESIIYEQYDSLAEQVIVDALRYGWRWPFVILGHYGVAIPAGRRSDPWLFDWGGFMGRLYVRAVAAGIGGLALVQASFTSRE